MNGVFAVFHFYKNIEQRKCLVTLNNLNNMFFMQIQVRKHTKYSIRFTSIDPSIQNNINIIFLVYTECPYNINNSIPLCVSNIFKLLFTQSCYSKQKDMAYCKMIAYICDIPWNYIVLVLLFTIGYSNWCWYHQNACIRNG